MSEELIKVEDTAPAVSNTFELVDVEAAKDFMDNYQEVVKALLDNTDYQKTFQGKFKKKSAWRKLATAFNISDDIIKEEATTDDNGQIINSKFYVKATLPNGRSAVGVGSCSIFDKITKKDKTQPSNFVLRNRFNNAEHDVPSTAHSRAKNRAISDLIGAGEVSSEEMDDGSTAPQPKKSVRVKSKTKSTPKKITPKQKAEPPKKDEEAIEVEVMGKGDSKPIKELMEEDKNIKRAVDELLSENRIVNKDAVLDRLITMMESGALKEDEYLKAKELLE